MARGLLRRIEISSRTVKFYRPVEERAFFLAGCYAFLFLAVVGVPMSQSRSFHIKAEQGGDVAVLQCAGRMVRGEALDLLKNAVTSLPGMRDIVLDLSRVEMLDCGGLGMLVLLQCWTRSSGIQLKLANPSNRAREVFERTGLTCVLHISSPEDAVDVLRRSDSTAEHVNRVAS
jgi:anti-anti-sigma factor